MGVPAFYKWLVEKYPKVQVNAIEDKPFKRNDLNYNLDYDVISLPNPNGLEFDNLYLDVNGIIHPCFHPDQAFSPPTTFDEVFESIFAYIDRLMAIVRPRKLLYLAIDGVAPRAKMNQQRSRRFRSAKDQEIAEKEEKRLREEFERQGKKLLPKLESELSDSNIITPGTYFMQELSNALNCYIRGKLKNDHGWGQLEVILSDATVPGEGEHKIMSFIRSKRSLPGYDPNTRHCIYGLDADLIMLALATHEVHFSILREEMLTVREEASPPETTLLSSIQKIEGQSLAKSRDDKPKPFFDIQDKKHLLNQPQRFHFLHIWILREYLELEMQIVDPPEKFVFDLERIIDDFIFICFFVGNDFLPHMPTLEIHERAIDLLLYVYKKEFKSLGGYLVDIQRISDPHAGYIKLKRVERFISSVGTYEEKIFKKRTDIRERKLRRIMSQLSESKVDDPNEEDFGFISGNVQQNHSSSVIEDMLANTKELNEKLKTCIRYKSDLFKDGNLGTDKVKLGSPGWKQRYYKEKFSVEDPKEVETKREEIVLEYTQGLCWVLLYYFSGIPSWSWFYPQYYGPFASDLRGLASVKVQFQKGLPFSPFDQLMAVLPPKSARALPKVYQELMTDCNSDIAEFYCTDFVVDVDGKRFIWQGTCKLPFIDEEKLLNATRPLEQKVEESERERNIQTTDKMFIRASHSSERDLGNYLQQHTEIEDDIMSFNFDLLVACLQTLHLLEGIQPPEKIIFENDIKEIVLWHEDSGRAPNTRSWASSVNKNSTNQCAGIGRGFDTSGRGKGITPNMNQSYHNGVDQWHPRNRGIQDLRISAPCANRPYEGTRSNTTQENRFWPSRNGIASHENTAWRPVSHSRPSFPNQGGGGSSADFRPRYYANTPQFMSRGRGRGRGREGTETNHQYPSEHSGHSYRNRWPQF